MYYSTRWLFSDVLKVYLINDSKLCQHAACRFIYGKNWFCAVEIIQLIGLNYLLQLECRVFFIPLFEGDKPITAKKSFMK
jgi:hypothetical protein